VFKAQTFNQEFCFIAGSQCTRNFQTTARPWAKGSWKCLFAKEI